ncbi:DEAD/DEAH box helicase [Aquimonas sp.]|jgi:superfamily II DNA or RNA helicase|uniref:DEAD/DEAH box helicase n=1 Tax=Aquimonas sp. TaxID=1872588 RepID=UPI0037BFDFC0
MTKSEFIALLQSQDWQRWFDPAALRGGSELASAVENVNFFDYGPGGLIAGRLPIGRTLGSTGISLMQTGKDKALQARWVCECRETRCLHAAALLLAITDTASDAPLRPSERGLAKLDSAPSASAALRGASGPEPERVAALLLKIVDTPQPVLLVQPSLVRAGKRGGYANPVAIEVGHVGGPSPKPGSGYSADEVERLNALGLGADALYGMPRSERFFLPVRSADQARALLALAETWPMLLERASGQRLKLGEPRGLELDWLDLEDGSQRLFCRVIERPNALVLEGETLLYLDRQRAEFGVLDAASELPNLLATAPALLPEHVDRVGEQLKKLSELPGLPPPRPRSGVQVLDAPPVPVLDLREQRIASRSGPRQVASARLSFSYAPLLLPALGAHRVERHFQHGQVYEVHRSAPAELAALERLNELGLRAADDEFGAAASAVHDFGPDDFVLPRGRAGHADAESWQPLLPRLDDAGFEVRYAKDYPARVIDGSDGWMAEVDQDAGGAWFNLSLGIEVNGERIDLMPVLRYALADPEFPRRPGPRESEGATYVAPLDANRRIRLPLQRLRALLEPLLEWLEDSGQREGPIRLGRAQSTLLEELTGASLIWKGAAALQRQLEQLRERRVAVEPPEGFGAELRPYQRDGLDWLGFLGAAQLGGILADDMGLGKTVQVLAHILVEKQSGRLPHPALVVAPTSLVLNWRNEARRFAPQLRVLVLHGSQRDALFESMAEFDMVITTYPLLPRDREVLVAQPFSMLVLDEAQTIKNVRTQAAQVVRELNVTRRLAMTGTPLENHLGELWAQMDAVEPGVLGSERQFNRLYRTPIEKQADAERQARLNRRIAPLVLRRRKQDVLTDLPPKTEILREVELEGRQRELYETLRLVQHERVREAIAERGLAQSGIIVLDALLKLRQVCCDPRLVKLAHARTVAESAKLDLLLDLLDNLLAEGRRVLVFSQFAEMLGLIQQALKERGIEPLLLTGQTRDRTSLVERFQGGEVPVFLISLKAGGVGLNLTAADTVIHYDPWWNPAVEAQATDRAHRIGQDKPVFVYRLICAGTVEEKIQNLQLAKAELARAVLDGGTTTRVAFGEDDLAELFAPLV